MYSIYYSLDQLEEAATFIWNNNSFCPSWPSRCVSSEQVKNVILEDIHRNSKKNMAVYNDPAAWIDWVSTGGYTLIFSSDEPNSISVDILVDPAIGKKKYRHVTEIID